MDKWKSFVEVGDEWLINHANIQAVSFHSTSVNLFSIGHAAELYLKAAFLKQTGDVGVTVGFGHNLKRILKECKKNDSSFLANYEFRDHLYDRIDL